MVISCKNISEIYIVNEYISLQNVIVVIKTTITLNKALTGLNSQIYFTPTVSRTSFNKKKKSLKKLYPVLRIHNLEIL